MSESDCDGGKRPGPRAETFKVEGMDWEDSRATVLSGEEAPRRVAGHGEEAPEAQGGPTNDGSRWPLSRRTTIRLAWWGVGLLLFFLTPAWQIVGFIIAVVFFDYRG